MSTGECNDDRMIVLDIVRIGTDQSITSTLWISSQAMTNILTSGTTATTIIGVWINRQFNGRRAQEPQS